MKKIVIAVAVACATLAAGGGAYAQRYDSGVFWRGAGANPSDRIRFLQGRIDAGLADRSLNRAEAARANRELQGVRDWVRSMHWRDEGSLTPRQRADVQARLDQISSQIRWMRHN